MFVGSGLGPAWGVTIRTIQISVSADSKGLLRAVVGARNESVERHGNVDHDLAPFLLSHHSLLRWFLI